MPPEQQNKHTDSELIISYLQLIPIKHNWKVLQLSNVNLSGKHQH